jgi:hypothetical protein
MIKSFLITLSFSTLLFSAQQIILVEAENFQSQSAILTCFEGEQIVCGPFKVNLGKSGLGWGIGAVEIPHAANEPLKYEGDKRAPAGIFYIGESFGYTPKPLSNKLPYLYSNKNLICVDQSSNIFYNQIIQRNGNEKSFEYMKRKDQQYRYGLYVKHNPNALQKRGSCIFLHIQKAPNHPTVGCTSMKEKNLKEIIRWLDKRKKPILIQLPKVYMQEAYRLYPQLLHKQGL